MLSVETSFCSGLDVATVTDVLIKNMKTILIHIFVLLFLFCVGLFFHYGVLFFFLSVICQTACVLSTITKLCKMFLDSKIEHQCVF